MPQSIPTELDRFLESCQLRYGDELDRFVESCQLADELDPIR